jgi:transposase
MSQYTTKYISQLGPGALFAGIDLGLDSLVVVVLTASAQRLDRFRTANNADGYAYLRQRLQRTVEKHQASTLLVGMEPTNYYWKQVGYDLERYQVSFRLVNALTVKRHREGDHLDRSKDDWRDAFTIADLLREGKFTETHLPHGIYAELQTGYTAYQRLRRDHGRQVTLLVNTVRQLFPEVAHVCHDLTGRTAAAILATGLPPQTIARLSEAEFVAQVRAGFTGARLSLRQVRQVYGRAAHSQGFPEATLALSRMVQQQIATLRLLEQQATQLREVLLTLFYTLPEAPYLLSIQGLTDAAALGLVAHTGDLRQYRRGAALIKLAGTQPTPNTSGRKTYSRTPFSHQGRSGLRTVLYFATLQMLTHNEAIQHHYQRLTTRTPHPLPKMQAVGACMNKVLWYAWHVVTHHEFYDPQHWHTRPHP